MENGTHLVDERVNALAVVFGLVPENRYNAMRNLFMGTETTPAYENASSLYGKIRDSGIVFDGIRH